MSLLELQVADLDQDVNFLFDEQVIQDERLLGLENRVLGVENGVDGIHFFLFKEYVAWDSHIVILIITFIIGTISKMFPFYFDFEKKNPLKALVV